MTATAILLTGAIVWDGVSDKAAAGQVLVQDGVITKVGATIETSAGSPASPGGSSPGVASGGIQTIDLSGHTLTPGFIDCHTHLTITPDLGPSMLAAGSAAKALRALPVLRTMLQNGFTTVRDLCGADADPTTVYLRDAVAAGIVEGPRMLVAPHMISARGGHGDFSGMLADEYQLHGRGLELAAADGPDEIRTRVRQEIRAGADWIKFAGSGGFSSPSDDPSRPTYSQEEMDVLVSTAGDLGVPATLHVYGDEGIQRAVRAGVRSVEHGNLASNDALKMIEDGGVFLVPTQYTVLTDARSVDDDAAWSTRPAYKRRKYQVYRDELLDAAERLAASDIKIAFGTDAGMFPHHENWHEFPMMVSTGMAPLRALKAATSVAAELLGLSRLGVIREGNIADLIAMPGNPFTDIGATGRVDFVMKEGVVHRRPGTV